MQEIRHVLDIRASDCRIRQRDRRKNERGRSIRELRWRLIGRGIVIGLCALACVAALALHTEQVAAAGYTVNALTDTGAGVGTTGDLRYAITQVNASTDPANTITITATGTITLASALPALAKPVAIAGPGAATLTVSGNYLVQVFGINSGVTASINNLTIANGNASGNGGGIENAGTLTVTNSTLSNNSANQAGGGIYNAGNLTVTNSTLSGSATVGGGIDNAGMLIVTNSTLSGVATVAGGGIYNAGNLTVTNGTLSGSNSYNNGGGIYNDGTLTVTNSTLSGNSATNIGGGIYNAGTLTVTNSTFSGNSVSYGGGGIYHYAGTLNLTNSTLFGNTATGSLGGGGIYNRAGTVTITNMIIAGNTASSKPDINGAVVSHGHNLIGKTDGSTGWIASDQTGTVAAPLNPLLGTLGDNGGTTTLPDGSHVQTLRLLSGSPAIDAGDDTVCARPLPPASPPNGAGSIDERGITRPQGSHCDIGAFEVQMSSTPNPLPAPKPPGPNLGIPAPLPVQPKPQGPNLGVPNPIPSRRP